MTIVKPEPMDPKFDLGRFILDFDPAKSDGTELGVSSFKSALPKTVPWPIVSQPSGSPFQNRPSPLDDLSKFHGYDAVIVTWTAAEASALASMLCPGFPTSSWYPYQHSSEDYIPLVTGPLAPFNDHAKGMIRYYHTMGLYFPCRIGSKKVLLFKSGLHLAYDGPATPVLKLMGEIARVVKPKIFITTGTGGGIGTDVSLGDVIVAGEVKFDCKKQFAKQKWANDSFKTAIVPEGTFKAITSTMVHVNASRIPGTPPEPKFFHGVDDKIVTTDFFAYDDSTNHFKLQGLGKCCEMGDAMVAQALHEHPDIKFYAIRNASDPQIPNPDNDMKAAGKQAASIYARYGGLTTAASVLACWAIIQGDAA